MYELNIFRESIQMEIEYCDFLGIESKKYLNLKLINWICIKVNHIS